MEKKVVLITGASSGIGRAIAEYLQEKGYKVYGGSRKIIHIQHPNYTHIPLDITDPDSVDKSVKSILEKEGQIDVLINSAGYGLAGPVEQTATGEVNSLFETNFIGCFRMCKAVLPAMRKYRRGKIINISSLGGIGAQPFQGFYCASKFALEGMTEALRIELAPFGIHVVLVEPGNFNTSFTKNRVITKEELNRDYSPGFPNALSIMKKDEINGNDPEIIARLVHRIIRKSNPKLRYMTGPLKEKLFISFKGIIPESLYQFLMKKHYNLTMKTHNT